MNKLFLFLFLCFINYSFGAATVLSVVEEVPEPKSPTPESPDRKIEMPNVIADDKHKKMRHYPLTREQRPKSYTTPALQASMPGEIRFLHPSVSQVVNRSTLPEYQLEAKIARKETCRKACACIGFTVWALLTFGAITLAARCKN